MKFWEIRVLSALCVEEQKSLQMDINTTIMVNRILFPMLAHSLFLYYYGSELTMTMRMKSLHHEEHSLVLRRSSFVRMTLHQRQHNHSQVEANHGESLSGSSVEFPLPSLVMCQESTMRLEHPWQQIIMTLMNVKWGRHHPKKKVHLVDREDRAYSLDIH